ncbi:MAG: valine--tRNA ligase [Candidatus Magasanikbacteria bacterium CG10_big_fil_rev_8_21_14_0_10_36_32]|uniref:Valine--tRNA ligase n=1 Tax=Candidatus Magasanikbacteria bacterium CG10_big_fil_rev_8_21_14_0_10_36_32 TaxID=1974646 RepID=A0A2M6W685_9BACT|nr:MAG: valine--tRNA ligase [Candidatus Magasanikbacteria bacterium CG10_big_fil_rev_8_21_14_0_10_36_32]
MKELSKAYEPKKYEDGIYKRWLDSGFFNPENLLNTKGQYVNILPPPNANGEMHIGHASGYVVMDLLGRYHRMKGEKTLLLPGKDHAGIQSQVVYEKKIKKERGITRCDLGREKFYDEIFSFCKDRAQYMREQEKKIGLSADWSREKFTMDPELVKVVLDTFVKMYNEVDKNGNRMIYQGERIINWCPRCFTALSDVEVEHLEQKAKLYTFKYNKDFPFSISTTRPETKLGDTAIAVNPKDERYKKYIGKIFEVDFVGLPLKIKIIVDHEVDSTFGTGALGVTPAHSAVDWEMARKNDLPIIKVIDEHGKIHEGFKKFSGMPVNEAREMIVNELREHKLLEKEEDYPNNLSVCERCQSAIEPMVSKQWFVNVDHENFSLKKAARKAIENDEIKIYPERFKDVMLNWIDNIRDWCISRQIWWGPRIPVWYCARCEDDRNNISKVSFTNDSNHANIKIKSRVGKIPVAVGEKPLVCPVDERHGNNMLFQDEDTLDTWFSSGQWAYSTLGFPNGKDFKEFYPSDMMVMGRDILPFWAFRMIIMSLYCTGQVPFKNLYFTGLIRDEKGQKMSKSKGNGIDPKEVIEKYGTDAVRLSLLIGNSPGNDLNLGEEKIAGFRNFTNKLWNICRFMLLNIDKPKADVKKPVGKTLADKWILLRLNDVASQVKYCIENYNLSMAGEKLRDFTWGTLADWYLEMAKIEGKKSEILNYILNNILKLWHPFMPFVTEQIWQEIYKDENCLMIQKYPEFKLSSNGSAIDEFTSYIVDIITSIRSLRADYKIEPAKKINVAISAGQAEKFLNSNEEIIKGLARIENLKISKKLDKPQGSIGFVSFGVEVFIDLLGLVDTGKEKERLSKEIAAVEPYLIGLEKKLSNQEFVSHAPKEVVEKEKQKLSEGQEKLKKLKEQLKNLI